MREILFRGKRVDNSELVIGDGIHYPKSHNWKGTCWIDGMAERANDWVQVIPETVGQYTGLTDMNGVKIFEGDIFTWDACKTVDKYVVVYKDGMFEGQVVEHGVLTDFFASIFENEIEIVGNIYDNPELLKGDKL